MQAAERQLSVVERVREKILHDVTGRRLDLGTMVGALRLVTDGAPGIEDARTLAEAARVLPPEAHAFLLRAAREAWQRGVEFAVARALRRSADATGATIGDCAAVPGRAGDISPELGCIVQALTWAALPPLAVGAKPAHVRLVAEG